MQSTQSLAERDLTGLIQGLELVALSVLGDRDQAKDAAQETVLRMFRVMNERGIPESYSIETYAFGILKHVLADAKRSERKHFALPGSLRSPEKSPLEQLVSKERVTLVERVLSRLHPSDRDILERCFWRDQKVADIARAVGEPADRIRKRKSRALERCRALLAEVCGHTSDDSTD
jgi:RNA polymerase sigma factor (sigma-70 family)